MRYLLLQNDESYERNLFQGRKFTDIPLDKNIALQFLNDTFNHQNSFPTDVGCLEIFQNFSQASAQLKKSQSISPVLKSEKKQKNPSQKKKEKASLKKKGNIYEKNICTYTIKICYKCFISPLYAKKIMRICKECNCDYKSVMKYYRAESKVGFGINRLTKFITPINESQISLKQVFSIFLNWFLRTKYMTYLLQLGKMQEKEIYISFKNKYLLYITSIEKTCDFGSKIQLQ